MAKGWLTGLMRARQAQEDVAKHRKVAAEIAARRARAALRYEAERLSVLGEERQHRTVTAFLAASVAMQAAAATHSAAERAAHEADTHAEHSTVELHAAARARRTVERLHEEHVAAERAALRAVEQRELDEIAARRHGIPEDDA